MTRQVRHNRKKLKKPRRKTKRAVKLKLPTTVNRRRKTPAGKRATKKVSIKKVPAKSKESKPSPPSTRKGGVQSSAKVSLPSVFKGIIKGAQQKPTRKKKVDSPITPNSLSEHSLTNSLESHSMSIPGTPLVKKKSPSPAPVSAPAEKKKKAVVGAELPSTGWSTQANVNSRPNTLSREFQALKKIFESKPKSKTDKGKKKARIKVPPKKKDKKILDLRVKKKKND